MIAVVVLTYRAAAGMLERCVASVIDAGRADLVVVVDNGGDVARVDRDALPPAVVLLRADENLGYAGGMNAGIAHALAEGATAVALLNDDTLVTAGWLAALAPHLDDPTVGAVQPKLLLGGAAAPDGPPRLQSVGLRTRRDGAGIDVGYGEVDAGQHDTARPIEAFTGGAVLLAGRFLAGVGGFDERYFLYYEDIELSRRGREAGWTFWVEPAAVVHHDMSATAGTAPERRRYWQERNRLWCLFRHGSPAEIVCGLGRSAARLARHPASAAQRRAIGDGLAQARTMRRERRAGRVVVSSFGPERPIRWTVS